MQSGPALKAVAKDVIKNSGAITAATSSTCVAQFRKINDTRTPSKSLAQKLRDKIDSKCVPGFTSNVTHSLNDITGHVAGGVTEKIRTANIDTWCKHFGGGGSIDAVADWEDCIITSHNCDVAAAIAAQFPRAGEWLTTLQSPGNMPAVPTPTSDTGRTSDAVAGANLFAGLIDPDGDGIPNPTCGGQGVACSTACCYVENLAVPPDTECFEYTGPPAQATAFKVNCDWGVPGGAPGSRPAGSMLNTWLGGPCAAGPFFGTPCVPGGPLVGNLHVMPSDSSCP